MDRPGYDCPYPPISNWCRLSKPPFAADDAPPRRMGGPLPQQSRSNPETTIDNTTVTSSSNNSAGLFTVYDKLSRKWPVSKLKERSLPESYKQFIEGECEVGFRHTDDLLEFEFGARLIGQPQELSFFYLLSSRESLRLSRSWADDPTSFKPLKTGAEKSVYSIFVTSSSQRNNKMISFLCSLCASSMSTEQLSVTNTPKSSVKSAPWNETSCQEKRNLLWHGVSSMQM